MSETLQRIKEDFCNTQAKGRKLTFKTAKWPSPWHDSAEEHKQVFPQQKQLLRTKTFKAWPEIFFTLPYIYRKPYEFRKSDCN